MDSFGKIKKLSEQMASKQISCVELTKQYVEAIESDNDKLNAYVKSTSDVAMETGKARGQKNCLR